MRSRLMILLSLFALLVPVAGMASPLLGRAPLAEIALLPGWRQADGTHMAALRIDLAPGWKTYWRAPGESGLAPRFDWTGSTNLAAVAPIWPRPGLFVSAGLTTIGYSDTLTLPLAVTPGDPAAPIAVSGHLSLGICHDVCVPVDVTVSGVLPAAGAPPDPAIAAALADRPLAASEAGVGRVVCDLRVASNGSLSLTARIDLPAVQPPRRVAVVEPGSPALWASDATLRRDGESVSIGATLGSSTGNGTPWIDRDAIRITLIGANDAVDIQGCPAPGH
jgi:DsbC/DsbD-like thiol-disulfide interchange protein